MESVFQNAFIALRVLLTLPVSAASGEHSFSKLKLIKNYLHSKMKQDRLNGLASISIEHDVAQRIEIEDEVKSLFKLLMKFGCAQSVPQASSHYTHNNNQSG